MRLNIGKIITIDRGHGKKKVTYRVGIDKPTPKYVPDGERGYGDRDPSPVMFRPHHNRTDNCPCGGIIDNCPNCGGTGLRKEILR